MTESTQHACVEFLRLASMSDIYFFCHAALQLVGSQEICLPIELITFAILLCRNTKSKEYLRFSILNITNHIQSRNLRDSHCMACVGLIFFTSLFMTTLFFFFFFYQSLCIDAAVFFSSFIYPSKLFIRRPESIIQCLPALLPHAFLSRVYQSILDQHIFFMKIISLKCHKPIYNW